MGFIWLASHPFGIASAWAAGEHIRNRIPRMAAVLPIARARLTTLWSDVSIDMRVVFPCSLALSNLRSQFPCGHTRALHHDRIAVRVGYICGLLLNASR